MHVVLAYSGGLDTSTAIVWLKRNRGADQVTAVLVDVGQGDEVDDAVERAYALGADRVQVVSKVEAMVEQGVAPMLRVGATYDGSYLLGTAVARPFIAEALVEVALEVGAHAICHGATGKGNDYLRFEQRIKQLAPGLAIIAPWREWELTDRDQALAMLAEEGVSVPQKAYAYSVDANLWHTSYEGGPLEDLSAAVPRELVERMLRTGSVRLTVGWENGVPTSLNGVAMSLTELIGRVNGLLSETGYGWIDLVETRTNGLKSRGIYYTPAGTLLYAARDAINRVMFPKPILDFLEQQGTAYGKLLYEGVWDHPLRVSIEAAIASLYAGTHGQVVLDVTGNQIVVQGRTCAPSLFDEQMSGFGHMDAWDNGFSEALVTLQRMKYYSKPYAVSGSVAV